MNITSKTIIILFLIIKFSGFAQTFNDTIFTKTSDTIICQITMVNNHNIFYQYPKKRRTKATHISQELVLFYQSNNPQLLKITKQDKYPKCDTCQNWLAFKSGDTAWYGITPIYIDEEEKVIGKLSLKSQNSYTLVDLADVNTLYINDVFYQSIHLSKVERMPLYENTHATKIEQEDFLYHVIIEGKLDLYRFNYFVNHDEMVLGEASLAVLFGAAIGTIVFTESYKRRFKTAYFIKKDNKNIVIPKSPEKFVAFAENYLSDHQDIVSKVKSNEFKYSDIEEIFRIYNDQ
jgi:hypothetical protein